MKSKKMNADILISRIKVAIFAVLLILLVSLPIIGIYTIVSVNQLNITLASLETRLNQVDLENTSLDEAIERIDAAISKLEASKDDIPTPVVTPEVSEPTQEKTSTENIFHSAYDVQITATSGLRVRSEPSTDSEIIAILPYRTVITIRDDHNTDWYQLGERYQNGYIFKEYTSTKIGEIDVTEESVSNSVTPMNTSSINIYEPSNLSADEFNEIIDAFAESRSIDDSALSNCGEALVALEENYNFNGLFALSVSGLESGFGITNAAQKYNNPLGIMISGKIKSFDSIDDAFDYFGKFMSKNYFGNGRNTISSIGQKYCPGTATKWATDVTWFWNKLTAYV